MCVDVFMRRRCRPFKLGIAIRDNSDVLVVLCHFRKWSKDIARNELEGSSC